jgi:homoserine dehydrogenase
MTEPVRIGLLGRGTVGGAFHDLVLDRADAVEAAAGRRPEIVGVLRRSDGDFEQILDQSDIVVELIGGTDPARDYVLRALRGGRHVVTANKQLIAQFGDELFDAAREGGVQLRFEAAVAGVVPVIRVIQESLAATEITKVFGIVNGTTNFILSEMASTGASYADVLRRAQELGYAEADPTDDVGGADAAAKMAILARLAFGAPVALADVAYQGITEIQPDDISYAKELGLSLKLLGVAERRDGASASASFPASSTPIIRSRPSRGRSTPSWSRRRRSTRSPCLGPAPEASRPPRPCSATWCRSSRGGRPCTTLSGGSRSCATSARRSTCTWRSRIAPACSQASRTSSVATRSRCEASCSEVWVMTPAW